MRLRMTVLHREMYGSIYICCRCHEYGTHGTLFAALSPSLSLSHLGGSISAEFHRAALYMACLSVHTHVAMLLLSLHFSRLHA